MVAYRVPETSLTAEVHHAARRLSARNDARMSALLSTDKRAAVVALDFGAWPLAFHMEALGAVASTA